MRSRRTRTLLHPSVPHHLRVPSTTQMQPPQHNRLSLPEVSPTRAQDLSTPAFGSQRRRAGPVRHDGEARHLGGLIIWGERGEARHLGGLIIWGERVVSTRRVRCDSERSAKWEIFRSL